MCECGDSLGMHAFTDTNGRPRKRWPCERLKCKCTHFKERLKI